MPKKKTNQPEKDNKDKVRLQKVIADAGLASRRGAEELILKGRVTVDGGIIDTLPYFVDPGSQDVRLDGSRVESDKPVYVLLNKPRGYVCTRSHEEGPRTEDLVDDRLGLLHTVGRLDMDSTGLVILTNNGEFTNRVTHPRYGVAKEYEVTVKGFVGKDVLDRLRKGVRLAEAKVRCSLVKVVKRFKGGTVLRIVLKEGKNREIRRMLAKCDLKVSKLKRTAIGKIKLGGLKNGKWRKMNRTELEYVKKVLEKRS